LSLALPLPRLPPNGSGVFFGSRFFL